MGRDERDEVFVGEEMGEGVELEGFEGLQKAQPNKTRSGKLLGAEETKFKPTLTGSI